MKITNKMHKAASIVAAVLSILLLVSNVFNGILSMIYTYRASAGFVTILLTTLFRCLALVFCVVVLMRGKKDVLAAGLLILTMLIKGIINNSGVISMISYLVNQRVGGDMFGSVLVSTLIIVLMAAVTVAFYVLTICECFKPGKISGSRAKSLLIVFPIAAMVLSVLSLVVMQLPLLKSGAATFAMVTGMSAFRNVGSYIPMILMGIAFSIPVYEAYLPGYMDDMSNTDAQL